jgi:hypothetical protein
MSQRAQGPASRLAMSLIVALSGSLGAAVPISACRSSCEQRIGPQFRLGGVTYFYAPSAPAPLASEVGEEVATVAIVAPSLASRCGWMPVDGEGVYLVDGKIRRIDDGNTPAVFVASVTVGKLAVFQPASP